MVGGCCRAGGGTWPPPHRRPLRPCSIVRTKVYAVLELWVQVCGASAGMLQGGASGEALLSHLLSDISPPADALRVREASQRPWSSLDPASRPSCLPAGWCVICVPFPASCAAPGGALTGVCRPGSPVLPRS